MKIFENLKRKMAERRKAKPNTFKTLKTGAALATKTKIKLATLLAAFACCVTALVLGVSGLFGGSPAVESAPADAATTSSSLIVLNDGTMSSWGTVYKNNLTALYRRLGGAGVTTYAQFKDVALGVNRTICGVKTYGLTSSSFRSKNNISGESTTSGGGNTASGGNVVVQFGGKKWLVAMVSQIDRTKDGTHANNGELVMTLVYADSAPYIRFATYNAGGSSDSYPAGLYSRSFIRSYLTGSVYATSKSATTSGSQNSDWKSFTSTYSSYLVQPKYIGYQAVEDSNDCIGWSHTAPNEAYESAYTPKHASTKDGSPVRYYMGGIYSKSYGGEWKEDYVWLPSISELGQKAAYPGIWNTDENFRSASYRYWTRSNRCCVSAHSNIYMKTTGVAGNGLATNNTETDCRPAIHVNLKALNDRATGVNTTSVAKPAWTYSTNTTIGGVYYANERNAYMSYTGGTQSALLSAPAQNLTEYGTGDIAIGSGSPRYISASRVPSSTTAHYASDDINSTTYKRLYSVTATNNGDYYCSDGLYVHRYYVKMYRAVLTLGFNTTTLKYTGSRQAPSITSISAQACSTFTNLTRLTQKVGDSYLPTASNFSIRYYGTTAAGKTYSLTTTMPSEAGTYYMRVTLNDGTGGTTQATYWKSYYTHNFTLNDWSADPESYASGTDTYQRDYSFTISYGDISPTVTTASGLVYSGGMVQDILTVVPNTKTDATTSISTTEPTGETKTTTYTAAGTSERNAYGVNAGTYSVKITITAPYYNTFTRTYSASIAKRDISSSDVIWSEITSPTYNGGSHTPTPTVTGIRLKVGLSTVIQSVTSSATNDFEYSCPTGENDTNAGTAKVKVKAKSTSTNYTGETILTFTINKASVTVPYWSSYGTGVTKTSNTRLDATYRGSQMYGYVNATNTDVIIWYKSSTNLTFNYTNNASRYVYFTNATSSYYYVRAELNDKDNYQWTDVSTNTSLYRYLYIYVAKKDISSGVGWETISSKTYTGKAITPTPIITSVGSVNATSTSPLSSTSDFDYTYSNNTNIGTATITVKAKTSSTNYTGETTRTFSITRQSIAAVYWLDSQDDGITKSGNTLTTTFNNTKRSFKLYQASGVPTPNITSTDGNTSSYSGTTRTYYATNANTYTITYSLSSPSNQQWSTGSTADIVLTIKINKASITAYASTSNTYTGSSNPLKISSYITTTTVENAPDKDDLLYISSYVGKSVNDGTSYSSSSTAPTKAGTYYAYLAVKPAYSDNYSAGGYWTYTINRANVTVTWDTKTFSYTGKEQYPTFKLDFDSSVLLSARPTVNNFTCSGTGTMPGTYTRKAILAPSFAYNFKIAGNNTTVDNTSYTNTHCTRNFNIGDTVVQLPYWLEMSDYTLSSNKLTATANFVNRQLVFKAYESAALPSPEYTCTVQSFNKDDNTRTIALTNAGTYKFTFSISDDPSMHWPDGTNGDVILTIVVNKVKVASGSGVWENYSGLVYNGQPQGGDLVGYRLEWDIANMPAAADLFKVVYVGTTVSGASYNSTNKPTEAGTYEARRYIADDYVVNYINDKGEGSYNYASSNIAKRSLSDSAVGFTAIGAYVYNGTAKTPTPVVNSIGGSAVSSQMSLFTYSYSNNINAGKATVTITAVNNSNYSDSQTIDFTINKALVTSVNWDKVTFAYDGKIHCPAVTSVTTKDGLSKTLAPDNMFEVTGGQIDAGRYYAIAALKPQYAVNFTTSEADQFVSEIRTQYTIQKAYLELGFDNEEFTYNGLEQLPDFTLTTNSGVNVKSEMAISVIAREGSHLLNGTAIDVGSYTLQVSMAGGVDGNYVKQVGGVAAEDGTWTIDFEILPCNIKPVWSATKFDYNGDKQGTVANSFAGKPANGSDPFINLKVTYYSNGVALTDTPVHAGDYTVKVELADGNYRLVNASNAVISAAAQNFVINSVSFDAKGGSINWEHFDDIIFNGLPQGVTIDGYTTGVFAADRSRALSLQLLYAEVDEEGKVGAFTTREFTNAGNYMVRIVESFGDYTFEDIPFTIAKRKVTVEWKGDEKSRLDGDTIMWLYDGEEHSPKYSVKFEGGEVIYRDGVKVSSLEITYDSVLAGLETLTAQLVDNGYNSNFEITEASKTQKIEVVQFRATKVEWYEDGSSTPLADNQLEALRFETSKVYGENGPKLKAVAKTDFVTDSGVITGEIVLDVSYPVSFEGYWEVGDTTYKAVATFNSEDAMYCEFLEAVLNDDEGVKKVFVTFRVTDDRTENEKLTISWVIEENDEEIDVNNIGAFNYEDGYGWLNGVFTFLYNGEARYPYPVAIGEYNERVELSVGGTENCINSGTGHIVHVVPLSGFEIAASDSEYRFNIVPRPVVLEWSGASSLVFGDNPDKFIDVEADEELSTCGIADGDQLVITFDSLNVGTHTATAIVFKDGVLSENYILTNHTKTITITRRPVSVSQIDWSKSLEFGATAAVDESGNTYYVFMNDGTSHAPVAELNTTLLGVPVTVKLTVMGEQTAAGSYIAYAILDYRDEYSSNFLLVADETAEQLVETVASQRFDIAKMVIDRIIWTTAEGAEETEKIEYEYDGNEHIPYAVGVTAEGYRAVLNVWGAQTDAGDYTARVTDNCDFSENAKEKLTVWFSILAQKVSVEWLGYDENNEIHLTYDGTAKHPEVNVGGDLTEDDYYVTGFVNAGTYVANIVFTNPNYTLGDGSDATCEFIIDRRAVNVSWTGVGNHTPSGAEAGVMYWEYNGTQRGPVASATYGDIKFGEDLENKIIVSGRETNAGSYTATATLDYSVPENANYTLVNATKRFVITPYEIHVIWTGNEEADGAFEWEFDGTPYNPTAKYQLWNSGEDEWITPEKIMGAKSDVGEYIASIELPANCAFAVVDGKSCGEQSFRITKMKITKINWFASAEEGAEPITDIENFMFEYTGKAQLPLAFADGTGVELMVTGARINAGTGYIATATLKEAGNYELGANANSTFTFGISEKAVKITWNDTSDKGEFTWSYTGDLICPTAEFTDIEGNVVAITVTGSNVNVGTYLATAHDTFLNYYFVDDEGNEIVPTQLFTIEAKTLSLGDEFKWLPNGGTFTPAAEGGYDTYTFGYDGKVHQPTVECTINGKTIIFSYTISSESGSVTAMVNAGTYTLTAKSSDGNYTIPNEKVTVVITPREVSVVWGATQLEYTGSAQTPEAYYVDVNGQTIALAVTSETPVTTGKGKATATFAETDNVYGNYTLAAEEPKEFEVKSASTGTLKWDWATGKFIFVPATDSDTSADDCWTSENAALMPSKQTLTADDRREA